MMQPGMGGGMGQQQAQKFGADAHVTLTIALKQ